MVSGSPWEAEILKGSGRTIVKYRDTAVICANTAEPIEVPFYVVGWHGPKASCVRWGPEPPISRAIVVEWIGAPIVKYRHFLA